MNPKDPAQRFSDRVEDYARYRPAYPPGVYDLLAQQAGLRPGDLVADLGSGTGLLSELFLARGHRVLALEPNTAMRAAAEQARAGQAAFVSLPARAEHIPLAPASVDFVAAGQAFHWFEPRAARREVLRILRPGGQAALIWNRRHVEGSAFQAEYEQLLIRYGTDFQQVDHQRRSMDEDIRSFFGAAPAVAQLPNRQLLDAAGLRGRLLSSSYVPGPGAPGHVELLSGLGALFERHQQDGVVAFDYQTNAYFGRLA
ncbi:MAG: class I SAM-dependent methyltransferase [Anaerolineales bacterium]|nr:class I SAM-dependent methyltransferase [Anaerolineales bacterium]